MKIIDCEQGTALWLKARLGIPTASCFDKIVTPGGKLSTQATKYAYQLVAEALLGEPVMEDLSNMPWVQRGKELEPQAVQAYEFAQEVDTLPIGFLTTDDGRIGASPDRLTVDRKRGVEIKCPAPQTHVGYLLNDFGDAYKVQVQGQMWVGELEGVDRFSFHPQMPYALTSTPRDDAFIKLLSKSVLDFLDLRDEMMQRALSKGVFLKAAA